MKIKTKDIIIGVLVVVILGLVFMNSNGALFQGKLGKIQAMKCPRENVQYVPRAKLAYLLVRDLGIPLVTPRVATFSDVPTDHQLFAYVETAHAGGYLTGHPDGTFGPERFITRAEFASVIRNAYPSVENASLTTGVPVFTDVDNSSWYSESVKKLYASGATRIEYRPADNVELSFATAVFSNVAP